MSRTSSPLCRWTSTEGREGLIPISEIATGWIKYIRDHIREGQKVVCKVLHVDTQRGHIDLSLKDVNEHQRREKIREWKNESKASKWINFAAEASGEPRQAVEAALYKKYGDLYSAFEDIVINGREVVDRNGPPEEVCRCTRGRCKGKCQDPQGDAWLEISS